ncbi:hypothetical protein ACWDYJ_09535 [Streptomyces sp. NPDC003042]
MRFPLAPGDATILVDGNGTPTCNWGWTCLWMDANYYGRKYQWSDGRLDNLHNHGYPTGGNWGDKADELVM